MFIFKKEGNNIDPTREPIILTKKERHTPNIPKSNAPNQLFPEGLLIGTEKQGYGINDYHSSILQNNDS
jgi:hypothetical protein